MDNLNSAIEEMPIASIIEHQANGDFSAEEVVYAYMDRIARFDKAGPDLNAVLELNPDAPAIAAGLDAARRSGVALGPLHGVPILIKDNINTAALYLPLGRLYFQQYVATCGLDLVKRHLLEIAEPAKYLDARKATI